MMETNNKTIQRPFDVLIPTAAGDSIARRVTVQVPMEWDAELGEYLLTPEAHELIDKTKATGLRHR